MCVYSTKCLSPSELSRVFVAFISDMKQDQVLSSAVEGTASASVPFILLHDFNVTPLTERQKGEMEDSAEGS